MRHLTILLVLATGCSVEQSQVCADYLACQAAVDAQQGSSTVGTLEPIYGPDGTCWSDPASAASCDAGCTSGIQAAQGLISPVPPECEL